MNKISFVKNGAEVTLSSDGVLSLYTKLLNWLDKNGYDFKGMIHNQFLRKVFNKEELDELLSKSTYKLGNFYNINNSGKYIFIAKGNIDDRLNNILLILKNFGVDESSIKTEGFKSTTRVKRDDDSDDDLDMDEIDTEDTEDTEEVTPMKSLMLQDFWTKFKSEIDKVSNSYLRVTPRGVLYFSAASGIGYIHLICVVSSRYARVEVYLNKTKEQNKKLFDYFLSKRDEIESQFGDKLTFERLDNKIASRIKYEIPSNVYDPNNWTDIINFLKVNFVKFENTFQPIFDEIKNNPSILDVNMESEIDDTEGESDIEIERDFSPNPFRQAICVLGKSGKGKSTTVEKILDNYGEEMDYDFIIPTASTTNLLSQYSPVANDYIKSRLGKLIMNAYKEHDKLFTAVFDECHKSNVIEMINDELLQCISLYRNQGNRFISLDDDTAKLYKGLKTRRGNLLIPDNVGFIFLSSKPDVIISNSDFFNRVDIYVLTKQPPKDKEDISFKDIEYFTPVGNRENGSKSLEDIDRIKELNDAD